MTNLHLNQWAYINKLPTIVFRISSGMCGKVDGAESTPTGPNGRQYSVNVKTQLKLFVRAWQVSDSDSLLFGVSESGKAAKKWPTWCECSSDGAPTCAQNFDVDSCPRGKKGKMSFQNMYCSVVQENIYLVLVCLQCH